MPDRQPKLQPNRLPKGVPNRVFENVFKVRLVVEGIQPERALNRLAKSGICLFRAKKLKKTQIVFSVRKKDLEKVFAIYPNICYNSIGESLFSAYAIRIAGAEGAYKAFLFVVRRAGLVLGAALFLAVNLVADGFVLNVERTGARVYAREVTEILSRHGVKKFALYPKNRADEICAELLSLDGISYCSLKKTGVTVKVELRLGSFTSASLQTGDMTAKHTGVLISAAVLRGTLLKRTGESVSAGESVVGAYFLKEDGARVVSLAIARIVLRCEYKEEIAAPTSEEALAAALLAIDGDVLEKNVEPALGGYLVKISYEVTETYNF